MRIVVIGGSGLIGSQPEENEFCVSDVPPGSVLVRLRWALLASLPSIVLGIGFMTQDLDKAFAALKGWTGRGVLAKGQRRGQPSTAPHCRGLPAGHAELRRSAHQEELQALVAYLKSLSAPPQVRNR